MLKKYSNLLVNIFFIPLSIISLIASIDVMGDNFKALSKSEIILLDIIFIIILVAYVCRKRLFVLANNLFQRIKSHYKITFILILFLLTIWQVYLVYSLHGISGWDPGIIAYKATLTKSWVKDTYFSFYPNTLLFLLFEHFIWIISGKPSITTLVAIIGCFNIIFVDTAIVLIYRIVKTNMNSMSNRIFVLFISITLFGLVPWIAIPYTDCIAFLLCTILVMLIQKYYKKGILHDILIGVVLAIAYLIKPSLVIVFMAFIIISIFSRHNIRNLKKLLTMILTFIILVLCWGFIKTNNGVVAVQPTRSFSMFHYGAMGIYKNGSYSDSEVDRDAKIENQIKRNNTDKKLIISRYRSRGFIGTQSFFISKQMANTADGTFGWGKEGGFLVPSNKRHQLSKLLFEQVNKGQPYVTGYSSVVTLVLQFIWIILLGFILISSFEFDWRTQFIKYCIVGFYLFLLFFEGGRSRYLIQFLPILFIAAAIGFNRFCKISKIINSKWRSEYETK